MDMEKQMFDWYEVEIEELTNTLSLISDKTSDEYYHHLDTLDRLHKDLDEFLKARQSDIARTNAYNKANRDTASWAFEDRIRDEKWELEKQKMRDEHESIVAEIERKRNENLRFQENLDYDRKRKDAELTSICLDNDRKKFENDQAKAPKKISFFEAADMVSDRVVKIVGSIVPALITAYAYNRAIDKAYEFERNGGVLDSQTSKTITRPTLLRK